MQDRCAMKVGTDGVALGALVNSVGRHHILDIGAGTGLVSIMLAQKEPSASYDAIEIEHGSASQARENVAASPWPHINIIEADFNDFAFKTTQKYDLIVSNPPFFNNSLHSPSAERTTARHTDTLSFEQLCKGVAAIITDKGEFSVIIPADNSSDITGYAMTEGLHLKSRILLYSKEGAKPKRAVLTYTKAPVEETSQESYLINSDRYRLLTDAYYL